MDEYVTQTERTVERNALPNTPSLLGSLEILAGDWLSVNGFKQPLLRGLVQALLAVVAADTNPVALCRLLRLDGLLGLELADLLGIWLDD
jgi:hypothetical protein